MAGRFSFRAWQPVLAVLVAAGVAVVTNLVTSEATVSLVVLFVVLVATQVAFAVWQGHHDQVTALASARARRDEVLAPLSLPLPEGASALLPLTATYSPTMTWGRASQKRKLITWCTAEDLAAPVMVVSGPAGVGKSRLARAVGEELPAPWIAGRWNGQTSAGELVARIVACPEPVLVIVDDADTVPEVAALLEHAALRHGQIRVLLLARDGDGLRAVLRTRVGDGARWLLDPRPLWLDPVGEEGDRRRWFGQAVRAYARQLRVPPPDLAEYDHRPVGDDHETMLVLHARALLTVLDGRHPPLGSGPRRLRLPEVAQALLEREIKWWRDTADSSQWGLSLCPDALLVRAILALTMLPASTVDDAVRVLSRLPEVSGHSGPSPRDLAEWACSRYPAAADGTLDPRPHFVAEWLVASQLASPGGGELASALLTDLSPAEAASVFATLARASRSFPQVTALIGRGVGARHALLVPALDAVAIVGPRSRELDLELARIVDSWELDEDEEMALRARLPGGGLPRLSVALDRQRVARLRRAVTTDADRYRPQLAAALYDLGIALSDIGAHSEALVVKREAADVYRRLLAAGAESYRADLANALNNFGVSLAELGHTADAQPVFAEAVGLARGLAADDPDRYRRAFGNALCNLGSSLRDLGRWADALAPVTEAIAVYRRAIAAGQAAGQYSADLTADLAHALTSLGIDLTDLGRPAEALAAFDEAVRLNRELGDTDATQYRPSLAHALRNLGACLADLDRPADSLAAFTEAVDLGRRMYADNPQRHRADLANSLINFGAALSALGRVTDALPIGYEAVALYREMAVISPDRHRSDLASALTTLGSCLADVGRLDDAFAALEEAAVLYRELAAANADRHAPDLARVLHNLGVQLKDRGRRADAVDAKREAVALYREVVATNPERHRPNLARVLASLGSDLVDAGHRDEGFALRAEAVALWKVCADTDPSRFADTYRREDARLRRAYNEHGMPTRAIIENLADAAEIVRPDLAS